MSARALYEEIQLSEPGFDELRNNLYGLVVRIRDDFDRGLNVTFPAIRQYTHVDESYAALLMDPVTDSLAPGTIPHWLYEVSESENLTRFNSVYGPVYEAGVREWIVVLFNDVISVIGRGEPRISERTDDIRSFTHAHESLADL